MKRREVLAAAAGCALLGKAASAEPTVFSWGRYYPLPGGSNPRIFVLGEPPPAPRPTILFFRTAQQSKYRLGETLAVTPFAQLMAAEEWTECAVDLPCWSGCDRFPDEPLQNEGMAHRLANGRSLWVPAPGQVGVRERAYSGLELLASEGYVDLERVWTAGLSIGGPFALNYAAYDSRVRGVALFHPVTEFLALYEFAGHPNPEVVATYDVRLLGPQLLGRSLFARINVADLRVNTDAAVRAVREWVAAANPTETWVPDIDFASYPVAGHPEPARVYAEARDWLLAREP